MLCTVKLAGRQRNDPSEHGSFAPLLVIDPLGFGLLFDALSLALPAEIPAETALTLTVTVPEVMLLEKVADPAPVRVTFCGPPSTSIVYVTGSVLFTPPQLTLTSPEPSPDPVAFTFGGDDGCGRDLLVDATVTPWPPGPVA